MPGPGTTFDGPVLIGTRPQSSPTTPQINDYGVVNCMQRATITANSTNVVSATFYLPLGSVILDVTADTETAWSSGTAVASVGTVASDTTYAGTTDVHTAGRVRPSFTAAQLLAMGNVTIASGAVVASIAPTGATTAGVTVLTLDYCPTVQQYTGNT